MDRFTSDPLVRSVASALTFAVSEDYVSLIALAVIQPNFVNIVRTVYMLVAALSVMIVGAIYGEPAAYGASAVVQQRSSQTTEQRIGAVRAKPVSALRSCSK
jgi:hypothetical protein